MFGKCSFSLSPFSCSFSSEMYGTLGGGGCSGCCGMGCGCGGCTWRICCTGIWGCAARMGIWPVIRMGWPPGPNMYGNDILLPHSQASTLQTPKHRLTTFIEVMTKNLHLNVNPICVCSQNYTMEIQIANLDMIHHMTLKNNFVTNSSFSQWMNILATSSDLPTFENCLV